MPPLLGRAARRNGSCCGAAPGIDCADYARTKHQQRQAEKRAWKRDDDGVAPTPARPMGQDGWMCLTTEPAADVRRLAARIEALARWIREDMDAGEPERAEANAVAAIDAAVVVRELLGTMCHSGDRVRQLIA